MIQFSKACIYAFVNLVVTVCSKKPQIFIQYTKRPQTIPHGSKLDKMAIKCTDILCTSYNPTNFIQIGIFGLKKCHLATLEHSRHCHCEKAIMGSAAV
jgi:hypothetical protein